MTCSVSRLLRSVARARWPSSFDGAGLKKFVKRALTGEGLDLMRVSGEGEVLFADMTYDDLAARGCGERANSREAGDDGLPDP